MGEWITFAGVVIRTQWKTCVNGRRFHLNKVWNVERVDWLDEISSRKIIGETTRKILREAMDCGGYVTGGFARNLARCILFDRNLLPPPPAMKFGEKSWKWLERYCKVKLFPVYNDSRGIHDRTWKSGVGDIDVFFHTETDSMRTCSYVNSTPDLCEWSAPTLAGYGMEYVTGGNILQILTKFHGDPLHVLDSFDLANSKVYLDRDGLHWSDEWCELEESKLLGIDRWDKPNLLWRVNKWFSRNDYVDFRKGDHERFVDSILNTISLAIAGELKRFGKVVDPSGIRGYAKKYWRILPASELLKISLGYDTYDQLHAIKELSHRGNSTDTFTL